MTREKGVSALTHPTHRLRFHFSYSWKAEFREGNPVIDMTRYTISGPITDVKSWSPHPKPPKQAAKRRDDEATRRMPDINDLFILKGYATQWILTLSRQLPALPASSAAF
ncbi:MAG: hypothetical protein LBR29_09735 [Methylobacteriaceae bacterium]|jgi:hypothetical protein|nr:hypothetical protein [Methylobacteriaceae bacterium]